MSKHILPSHDHSLSCEEAYNVCCALCFGGTWLTGIFYRCTECDISMHKECVERFLNQPYICNHFLKIFTGSSLGNENHHCYFRGWELDKVFARCEICNISFHPTLLNDPPPLTIFQPKHHKHSLTLLLRLVTFTCNACGLEGDRNPYVCLECNFMVHKECTKLPRVISINRHDHRISHTFHLGQGEWECGVCRKTIDWVYGAFTCSRCPSYAVHSKCATRHEVWDRKELEDVPEEEEEIEEPFKVINKTDIIHFSHEKHILRLDENYVTDNDKMMRCRACVLPIYDDPCYKCGECDFNLHKACANLPRKKRHLLHNHKLTLLADTDESYFCKACQDFMSGFRYECEEPCEYQDICYDVRCSSISEPFHHDLHPHPLYFTLEGSKRCDACGTEIESDPLNCTVCDGYALCMKCAALPRKVKHRCDDHFLSLCQGAGNSSGDLWCDICETKTDPSVCYYTCDECGVSLHTDCVLGDLYYMKLGHVLIYYLGIEVFANDGVTRPLCSGCDDRCMFPFLLKRTGEESDHYCSLDCEK